MLARACWNPMRGFDRGGTTAGRFWWPWQASAGVILRTQHMIRLLRDILHGSEKWTIWEVMIALPIPAKWGALVLADPAARVVKQRKFFPGAVKLQATSCRAHPALGKKKERHWGFASLAVVIHGNSICSCCSWLVLMIYIVLYLVIPVMLVSL